MHDLEITKRCALAIRANGIVECRHPLNIDIKPPAIWVKDDDHPDGYFYSPLTEDDQAFDLIRNYPHECMRVIDDYAHGNKQELERDLNYSICLCVAQLK